MSEAQQREYVTGPRFAWRVSAAQFLRVLTIYPLIIIGIFVAGLALFSITHPLDAIASIAWILAALVAFLVLTLGLGLLISYASTHRHIPVGSLFTAQLKEHSLSFSGPLGTADIAYSAYRKAVERGGFVFLPLRSSKNAVTVLPAELFAGADFERLAAAIADAAGRPESPTNHVTLPYELVITSGYVGRLSRATTRFAVTRPATLTILILAALPGALGMLLVVIALLIGKDLAMGLGFVALTVALIGFIVGLSHLAIWRAVRRQNPIDGRTALGFTPTGVALHTPMYNAEIPYERLRGVKRRGEFTVLLTCPGHVIIPSAILPVEAEQHLLASIPPR